MIDHGSNRRLFRSHEDEDDISALLPPPPPSRPPKSPSRPPPPTVKSISSKAVEEDMWGTLRRIQEQKPSEKIVVSSSCKDRKEETTKQEADISKQQRSSHTNNNFFTICQRCKYPKQVYVARYWLLCPKCHTTSPVGASFCVPPYHIAPRTTASPLAPTAIETATSSSTINSNDYEQWLPTIYEHWLAKVIDQESDPFDFSTECGLYNSHALKDAPYQIRNDKRIVLAAVKNNGFAIRYASPELQNDKDIKAVEYQYWMPRLKWEMYRLECLPHHIRNNIRNNKFIVMAAVERDGFMIHYASPELQDDNDVKAVEYQYWLSKVADDRGMYLKDVPTYLRENKQIVLAAVKNDDSGRAVEYAAPKLLQSDKDIAIAAVKKNGMALQYLPSGWKDNYDVVLTAVCQNPDAIKYATDKMKRHPDILIAAGMYDEVHEDAKERQQKQQANTNKKTACQVKRKLVLSTRFSLTESTFSEATKFTKLLKEHEYIRRNFLVYAPNAFDKKTCDPNWTDFDHPCRGTNSTCNYHNVLTKDGYPTNDCCWRYSFRNQLEEAKMTGGFMLQLLESEHEISVPEEQSDSIPIGNGQKIEREMAQQIKLKVFHVYRPIDNQTRKQWFFLSDDINMVVSAIRGWYDNNCMDNTECIVRPSA